MIAAKEVTLSTQTCSLQQNSREFFIKPDIPGQYRMIPSLGTFSVIDSSPLPN